MTIGYTSGVTSDIFQSTPSAWRVTQAYVYDVYFTKISIHTLRVEGDEYDRVIKMIEEGISIHTLRVEGDIVYITIDIDVFNFNPHPPRGG